MLSVYKCFHQTIKYGCQRNHVSQDLTGLEIKIFMKALKPVFNNQKPVCLKTGSKILNLKVSALSISLSN